MKIYILAKIIVENYYNRYYTPMLDTGAEANMCKHNCLPDEKWEKLKTPIVVTGFNNEGSMITYKAICNMCYIDEYTCVFREHRSSPTNP